MTEREFSPEHRDFVEEIELEKLAAQNRELQEARYQDDVNILRADVNSMLHSYSAVDKKGGWAIYMIEVPIEEQEECSVPEPRFVEVLVMSGNVRQAGDGFKPQRIRMFTNELYKLEDGCHWLTREVTVDEDSDSQFFVDVVNVTQDPNFKESMAPIFWIADDRLRINQNLGPLARIADLCFSKEAEDAISIVPFGFYSEYEDKRYALDQAINIIEAIKDIEPVNHYDPTARQ